MLLRHDVPAAASEDADDDFLSASSGSQRSESPSPRTGSFIGAFTPSPHADGIAMAASADDRSMQPGNSQLQSSSVKATANGSFHGGKLGLHDAEPPVNGDSRSSSPADACSDIQPAAFTPDSMQSIATDAAQQQPESLVSPTQPNAEALLSPCGMAPLQVRGMNGFDTLCNAC